MIIDTKSKADVFLNASFCPIIVKLGICIHVIYLYVQYMATLLACTHTAYTCTICGVEWQNPDFGQKVNFEIHAKIGAC